MSTSPTPAGRHQGRVALALAILVVLGIVALLIGAYLIGHALDGEELGAGLAFAVGGLLAVLAGLRLDLL